MTRAKVKGVPRSLERMNADFDRRWKSGTFLHGADRRTILGRLIGQVEDALTAHLGGAPSFTQSLLIAETAFCYIVTESLQSHYIQRVVKAGGRALPSEQYTHIYSRWSTLLYRNLQALGFKRPEKMMGTLQSHIKDFDNIKKARDKGEA